MRDSNPRAVLPTMAFQATPMDRSGNPPGCCSLNLRYLETRTTEFQVEAPPGIEPGSHEYKSRIFMPSKLQGLTSTSPMRFSSRHMIYGPKSDHNRIRTCAEHHVVLRSSVSLSPGSNWPPPPYQGDALPTELDRQYQGCIRSNASSGDQIQSQVTILVTPSAESEGFEPPNRFTDL